MLIPSDVGPLRAGKLLLHWEGVRARGTVWQAWPLLRSSRALCTRIRHMLGEKGRGVTAVGLSLEGSGRPHVFRTLDMHASPSKFR